MRMVLRAFLGYQNVLVLAPSVDCKMPDQSVPAKTEQEREVIQVDHRN